MRFKIGDKVEVMKDTKEFPVSWSPAEVLFVGDHSKYLGQYGFYPGMPNDRTSEMFSRKSVRPRPPLGQDVESYIDGDTVEVLYQYSWKAGVILGIAGGQKEVERNTALQKQYQVRLIGCSEDIVIDSSNIRMRRMWDGGKWVLMGKSSQTADDVTSTKPSTSNSFREMNFQVPQYKLRASNQPLKHRSLKRTSPYDSSIQKLRAVEKDKVDAVAAYPKEVLGGKNMCASSFNFISKGLHATKRKHILVHSGFKSSELISSETDACSVGSCDIATQCLNTLYSGRSTPNDDLGSDAESFYGSVPERRTELEVSVRGLELHAYRTTLEALYASGPLSWEQEAMLTNLRIMLHISNDEHLKELKHLISTKTGVGVIS